MRTLPRNGGWIEIICGPMYSGKSEEMIRRLRREQIAGRQVVVFKPAIDDRDSEVEVVSRAGGRLTAIPVGDAAQIAQRFTHHEHREACAAEGRNWLPDVVGIDEVQFFDEDVVEVAIWLADYGVRVICAGLDLDYRREPFGPVPELLARAEFVDKEQAVCHRCGHAAFFTQRLVDGKPAPYSGETIQVGGAEAYEARCRDCFETGD